MRSQKRSLCRKSPKQASLINRSLYNKPTRNYFCQKLDINECIRNLKNVVYKEHLGEGSGGHVYRATAILDKQYNQIMYTGKSNRKYRGHIGQRRQSSNTVELAVKIIDLDEKNMEELFYEIEYSMFMGEVDIGPIVYESFYKQLDDGKLKQYIFMEYFEKSAFDAINDLIENPTPKNLLKKDIIVSEMIRLLKKQIFEYNMYCMDIKPENYVVNLNTISEGNINGIKVRMIDFDAYFCKFDTDNMFINQAAIPNTQTKIIVFYLLQLLQLYHFIKEYDVIKIFQKDPYFNKILDYENYIFYCLPKTYFINYHGYLKRDQILDFL